LDRRLGGSQNRSGCGEEKNSQLLLGLEPLIIQRIAQCYITELSRFLTEKCSNNITKTTKKQNDDTIDKYFFKIL
jgi:hypothetical protein